MQTSVLCVKFETFRRQVKQTACFVSSFSSAGDEDEDDGGVLETVKQIVSERAKLKAKVQVIVVFGCQLKLY